MAHAPFWKPVVLINFAGAAQIGTMKSSTYFCMAAISLSKSTPRPTVAWLKHVMVGISPWLNAPNTGRVLIEGPPLLKCGACCHRREEPVTGEEVPAIMRVAGGGVN